MADWWEYTKDAALVVTTATTAIFASRRKDKKQDTDSKVQLSKAEIEKENAEAAILTQERKELADARALALSTLEGQLNHQQKQIDRLFAIVNDQGGKINTLSNEVHTVTLDRDRLHREKVRLEAEIRDLEKRFAESRAKGAAEVTQLAKELNQTRLLLAQCVKLYRDATGKDPEGFTAIPVPIPSTYLEEESRATEKERNIAATLASEYAIGETLNDERNQGT